MITSLRSLISHTKPFISIKHTTGYILIDLIISALLLMFVANWLIISFGSEFQLQYFQTFLIICIVRLMFFNWLSLIMEIHLIDIKMLLASEISRTIMKDKLTFELIKNSEDENAAK